MRGRTNIPPRNGGIVNGTITECLVAEPNGISVGDYVQLVQGSGVRSNESKQFSDTWMFGAFALSDGTMATFYYKHPYSNSPISGLFVNQATVGVSGFVNEGTITSLDVSDVLSSEITTSEKSNVYIIELSEDKFLVQMSKQNDIGFCIVTYAENQWSVSPLTITNPPSVPSGSTSVYYKDAILCRITEDEVAFGFGNALYIAELSDTSISFVAQASATENAYLNFIYLIGEFLLVLWGGTSNVLCTYSIFDLSLVESYSSLFSAGRIPEKENTAKLSENRILCLSGIGTQYYSNPDGYLRSDIITVNIDGSMSISTNTQAIPYNVSYNYAAAMNAACPYVFEDNRIIAFVPLISRESSNPYKYKMVKLYASMGTYDEEQNTVEFEAVQLFSNDPIGGNTTSTQTSYDSPFFLNPIEVQQGLLYFVAGMPTSTFTVAYQYVTRVEQLDIVGIGSEYPMVKKYSTRINGVAKTGGLEGFVIEVYSPSKLM